MGLTTLVRGNREKRREGGEEKVKGKKFNQGTIFPSI